MTISKIRINSGSCRTPYDVRDEGMNDVLKAYSFQFWEAEEESRIQIQIRGRVQVQEKGDAGVLRASCQTSNNQCE